MGKLELEKCTLYTIIENLKDSTHLLTKYVNAELDIILTVTGEMYSIKILNNVILNA